MEQALFTQPDCAVVMISNYAECREIEKALVNIDNIVKIDGNSNLINNAFVSISQYIHTYTYTHTYNILVVFFLPIISGPQLVYISVKSVY